MTNDINLVSLDLHKSRPLGLTHRSKIFWDIKHVERQRITGCLKHIRGIPQNRKRAVCYKKKNHHFFYNDLDVCRHSREKHGQRNPEGYHVGFHDISSIFNLLTLLTPGSPPESSWHGPSYSHLIWYILPPSGCGRHSLHQRLTSRWCTRGDSSGEQNVQSDLNRNQSM